MADSQPAISDEGYVSSAELADAAAQYVAMLESEYGAEKRESLVTAAELRVRIAQESKGLKAARARLATLLLRGTEARDECDILRRENALDGSVLLELDQRTSSYLRVGQLDLASRSARLQTDLIYGAKRFEPQAGRAIAPRRIRITTPVLTIQKLRHDIEQFEYLRERNILGDEFCEVINHYEDLIRRLTPLGPEARMPLSPADEGKLGDKYSRLIHVRESPELPDVLSGSWNREAVESEYLNDSNGVAVVDDFLTAEALESVRSFCLESTIWFTNRYAHGRFGAFFREGFNSPLLLQIAREVAKAFPAIVGDRTLRQLWGFKYGEQLPGETVHADFAAVNLNIWITPESANRDAATGGLYIYDCKAPLTWSFDEYNRRPELIRGFLRHRGARSRYIPYKVNRAIFFNSNLFHGTAPLDFRAGYENRRINVSFLYGDRMEEADDLGSPRPSAAAQSSASRVGWRSASFARFRTG
ncbi:hypothetical protein [Methylocapsa sp. S129]|uniref:hypothetical protein n=1 Tax=Methylocapsa sp. S129 TaxID=1641869 RepID=UPI00131AD965|nr:hypothetical protein [Methylocapsa sp. S129]